MSICRLDLWLITDSESLENQEYIVSSMMHCNEIGLAIKYQKTHNLPESLVQIDEERLEAFRAEQKEKYHQLGISTDRIRFVSTPEQLEEVALQLRSEPRVGFDLEWKSGTESRKASILQVGNFVHN